MSIERTRKPARTYTQRYLYTSVPIPANLHLRTHIDEFIPYEPTQTYSAMVTMQLTTTKHRR